MTNKNGQEKAKTTTDIAPEKMSGLPKLLGHEHFDCSPRHGTLLELWSARGFHTVPTELAFPQEVIEAWSSYESALKASQTAALADCSKTLSASASIHRDKAIALYREYLLPFAASSLDNYVKCVLNHILPVMQTRQELTRIFRERLEDAVADGVVGLELRFAPQLHTWQGLSLTDVMDTMVAAMSDSPIHMYLTVCALRHENGDMARKLADLCVQYKEHVGCFDLAANEAGEGQQGVLDWWAVEAVRARDERSHSQYPLVVKCHLWETNKPTAEDVQKLERYGIGILGHGIHGDQQGNLVLEVNPTSNVVIGQVARFEDHPIDRLYREGKKVTLNTDGLTLTGLSGLTEECLKMNQYFAWGFDEFHTVFTTQLAAMNFAPEVKAELQGKLDAAYLLKK